MFDGTDVGTAPHARTDEPSPNISGDQGRCACGQPADGFDARRGESTCEDCATIRADGGVVKESTGDQQAPEMLECATCTGVAEQMSWGQSEYRVDYRCRQCECGGHITFYRTGEVKNRVGPVFRAHRSGVQTEARGA